MEILELKNLKQIPVIRALVLNHMYLTYGECTDTSEGRLVSELRRLKETDELWKLIEADFRLSSGRLLGL